MGSDVQGRNDMPLVALGALGAMKCTRWDKIFGSLTTMKQ